MNCQCCGKLIDNTHPYGKGIFCNKKCQISYAYEQSKDRIAKDNSIRQKYKRVQVDKICSKCLNHFSIERKVDHEGTIIISKKEAKYCSYKCSNSRIHTKESKDKIRKALTIKPYEKVCNECGRVFFTKRKKQKSCSNSCGRRHIGKKQRKINQLEALDPIDLFNRYGITVTKPLFNIITISSQGKKYNYAYVDNHPYMNKRHRVVEHRAVMELHLNRFLTKKEIIHHIDGNGKNNKVQNLQLVTNREHYKIHHYDPNKYITLTCPTCKKEFTKRKTLIHTTNYCSRACVNNYTKKRNVTERLRANFGNS